LFLGMIIALGWDRRKELAQDTKKWVLWLPLLLIGFEFLPPIPKPLERPYDIPPVYHRFREATEGNVLIVPFSATFRYANTPFRDERRFMLYQMAHEHPIVGGFSGRTPYALFTLHRDNPFLLQLARAQNGEKIGVNLTDPVRIRMGLRQWQVRYVVVEKDRTPDELEQVIAKWPVRVWADEGETIIFEVKNGADGI
jgi:hypothetical protein